jgi:arsenate reductase
MTTKVLFLCTGNCCRSQMAEALLRRLGGGRFEAFSAGSHPAGYIHPVAVAAMERMGIPMTGQRSKSWDEFAQTPLDVVITVCDAAAKEICPVWPGRAIRAFWPLPDPSFHPGTSEERLTFALAVAVSLRDKIQRLMALDFEFAPESDLKAQLDRIGQ